MAVSLLNTGGATAVTADAIAERAKVSRATVYRFFKSGVGKKAVLHPELLYSRFDDITIVITR